LNSKILLGIIAVTILGTFAVSGLFVQAGLEPNEITRELGNQIFPVWPANKDLTSTATCPLTHKVIGGGIQNFLIDNPALKPDRYEIFSNPDFPNNSWEVRFILSDNTDDLVLRAYAICQKINFPLNMGSMIGGELLDINSVSLLIGAIGTNPIITALMGITIAGIAGQAVWFVHRRKKKSE